MKAHGALYNMAVRDRGLADAIARATAAIDRSLILFGLPGSELMQAGEAAGLRVAAEAFADRAYEPDGTLASRRKPGSVIHDPAAVVARAVEMVTTGYVIATDGSRLALAPTHSVLHGDTPGSADARPADPRGARGRRCGSSGAVTPIRLDVLAVAEHRTRLRDATRSARAARGCRRHDVASSTRVAA